MASKREDDLKNQITFRNEMLDDRKIRMENAVAIMKDIYMNYECGSDVDAKLSKAIDIIGGHLCV